MSISKEIYEQPEVIARFLNTQRKHAESIAAALAQRSFDYIFLVARGSSDNAGLYAKYLFGIENKIPVAGAAPSMFTAYGSPPRLDRALVLAISQSGRSPDLVAAVVEARRQGAPTVVITNDPSSPLATAAEFCLDIGAGPECAVAATKSYTGQLTAVALLSAAMAKDRFRIFQLDDLPDLAAKILRECRDLARTAERYRFMERCVVLGRGYNYSTAFEWSLKMKELTYVVAEPYSSADFRHGPIAVVQKGFPIMAVVTSGAVGDDLTAVLAKLRNENDAEIFVVSDMTEPLAHAHCGVRIPGVPEWLSPILAILPGQLFTYHLTLAKGYDADHPRGLSKVTKTL